MFKKTLRSDVSASGEPVTGPLGSHTLLAPLPSERSVVMVAVQPFKVRRPVGSLALLFKGADPALAARKLTYDGCCGPRKKSLHFTKSPLEISASLRSCGSSVRRDADEMCSSLCCSHIHRKSVNVLALWLEAWNYSAFCSLYLLLRHCFA